MPAEEQHTDSGPSLCAICGDEVDEAVDYTTALTCSFWGCGRHNVKGLYHTECVGDYQRQNSITKGANTGYLCPRGNSRAEIDKDNPCRGKIQATHHRLPNKKKKQPPQPLPAAMFPSRQLQAPKPKAPKPHTPGPPPKAPKPVSKEAIQRQVLACRQATQATQGDSVLERLRGGPQPQQPSVIPGMEFEVKKKKPAKKKSKASKQHQSEAPQEGAAADGKPAPKSVSLTQLPNIMPKMDGENYITDLNRYNLLVGGQYSSEDETDDEPNYSPSASDFGSLATADTPDPWGGVVGTFTTPSPEPPPYDGPPPAAHGVVDWGTAPGGADAVFDFGSLNIDFGAGVPEEIITYMASLPDELSELYLSELGNHMTKLQEANNAAVAEHQQQLQAELLEQERRDAEQQQALRQLAAEQAQQQQQQQQAAEQARLHAQQLQQQQQAQEQAEQRAREQQQQAQEQAEQRARVQQQQQAQEQAEQKAREQQQQQQQQQLLAQQQALYYAQLHQQQQLDQQQQKQAAYAPVQIAPAVATADASDEVDDLLALCLGED